MSNIVQVEQLPIATMSDLEKAGELLAQSGMFGCKNKAEGFVIAATCKQQNISLLDFIRTYHLIDNKPAMRADSMAAEFRKRGGKYKIIERSQQRAAAEFEFEGNKCTFEYTMEQAKNAGYCYTGNGQLKTNWQRFPENMLWARMISNAIRVLCPEINAGIYTPEEVADFDTKDTTPKEKVINPNEVTIQNISSKQAPIDSTPVTAPQTAPSLSAELEKSQVEKELSPDYTRCPIGRSKGKPWTEFPIEYLQQALELPDDKLPKEYKDEVRRELEKRQKQKSQNQR